MYAEWITESSLWALLLLERIRLLCRIYYVKHLTLLKVSLIQRRLLQARIFVINCFLIYKLKLKL